MGQQDTDRVRTLSVPGSGKLIGKGRDEVSGRLNFRRPLQLRSAMPSGHDPGSIFGGGRGQWFWCAAEGSKRGHAGPGIPVLAFGS